MATTQNTFTGDGSTTNFSFTFEYIKEADVKATLDGTATTAFTLANATTLSFNTAPANGVAIRIFRDTDINSLKATFFPGSAIKAEDLNDNFTQNNFAVQEADFNVDTANATADTAKTNSETAIATANTADTNASAAVATANTADTNASAAVATANTASTNASNAVSTANAASTTANSADANATLALNNSRESDGQGGFIAAITKANTAIATANTASTNATSAVNTANAATTTANTASTNAANAVTTANSAASDATSAVSTANTASTNATNAVTTANSAAADATSAVATANTASTNASNAVSTANTADTNATAALNNSRESDGQGGYTSAISKANTAITTANTATAAVSNAVLFDLIANVAAIPGSPSNNDYIEIADSTGIQNFTPLSGLPSGFVGASGLTVRLRYDSSGTTWAFMNYFANDSETRYVAIGNPNPVYYANQAAFPSATTYHGGIAHSHADGAMYYAHGGNWIKMASESDVSANTSSIATNTTNIGTNTTDIASQNTRLGTAEADIITLVNSVNQKFPTAGGTFSGNVEVGTGIDLNTSGDATFNGNIGVGTTSPSQILELKAAEPRLCLNGTTANSDKGIEFEHNGTRTGHLFHNYNSGETSLSSGDSGSSYFITFKTDNSERMRLDSSGRLGIATTTPGNLDPGADDLVVGSGSGDNGITIYSGNSNLGNIYFADGISGSDVYTGGMNYDHSTNSLALFTNGGQTALRINSDQRVLIGTNTNAPYTNRYLTIGDTSSANTYFEIRSSTSGMGGIVFSDGTAADTSAYRGIVDYSHGSDTMSFYTSAAQRFVLGPSGQFGIGGANYGSSGEVLMSQGSGAAPTWGTATPTIASQAEAEAGTDNTKMMTPLRVAQAIAAQGGSVINSIQRGVAAPFNIYNSGTTGNVSISSVNTSKTMVNNLGQTASTQAATYSTSNYEGTYLCMIRLTSSTQVQLERISGSGSGTSNAFKLSYEVIEFT